MKIGKITEKLKTHQVAETYIKGEFIYVTKFEDSIKYCDFDGIEKGDIVTLSPEILEADFEILNVE
jgi:hypothetical protein